MKRLTLNILSLLLPLALLAQAATPSAPTADEILLRFLSKIDSQTLTASVNITLPDGSGSATTFPGTLQMRGEKFLTRFLGNEAAYDGRTYYQYSEESRELLLTHPTPQELMEANPVLFARELIKVSRVRYAAGAKADQYAIELLPTNQSAGIQKFSIRLRKTDLLPIEVRVHEDAQVTTLRFTSASYSSETPSFTLSHPDAFINDLR